MATPAVHAEYTVEPGARRWARSAGARRRRHMPHPMPASQSCAPQDGKGGGGGGGGMRGERVGEGGHVSHETGQLARPWGKSQQLEQSDIEEHGMEPPPLVQNKPLFD